ncbi:MAG: hypothetical protein K2J70_04530, partial [Muribaculaceae bacterium]|nr:hypothetical protein [Muribaculaceae bacterium]
MPWVRKIHFLTWGHLPEWLNTDNPKVEVHNHKDFFDDNTVFPVFSSHPIEMNIRNIPGLAEKFIYFNDDTLVVKPVSADRFFQDGRPVDYLVFDIPRGGWLYDHIRIKDPYAQVCRNSVNILNDRFPFKELRKKRPELFFDSSYLPADKLRNRTLSALGQYKWIKVNHNPQGFLLSNLNECFHLFGDAMKNTCKNRFRSYEDLNQYLFRYYALAKGEFAPHYFDDDHCIVLSSIGRYDKERWAFKEKNFVCINDSSFLKEEEYPRLRQMVRDDLEDLMPEKSSFEL